MENIRAGKYDGCAEGSSVEDRLMREWDRLAERESCLLQHLGRIEDAVLVRYPEAELARLVVKDIRHINKRTPLLRKMALMKMKKRACQLIETADREISVHQRQTKIELIKIKKLIMRNEEKMREEARKRLAITSKRLTGSSRRTKR